MRTRDALENLVTLAEQTIANYEKVIGEVPDHYSNDDIWAAFAPNQWDLALECRDLKLAVARVNAILDGRAVMRATPSSIGARPLLTDLMDFHLFDT